MIAVISFVFNIILTLLFVHITNNIYKSNRQKAIAFCKLSLGIKLVIYILCVLTFVYSLRSIKVIKLLLMFLPILYLSFLLLLDSVLFFKTIKKLRGATISFKDYLPTVFLDILIIMSPCLFVMMIRNFFGNNETLYAIALIIFALTFNLLYPVLMRLKYKAVRCKDNELELLLADNRFRPFIYNGTAIKEANVLVCGIIPPYSMLISDYLIEHTTKQELQAIIYHEIGHIKKVHLPIRVLLMLSAYPIFVGLGAIMDMYLYDTNIVFGLLIVCSSLILYGMLYFYIVRYQEYQADYYAIKECKDKHAYISALQKLQQLNDTLSKKSKARVLFSTHPTTENRIKRINKKFKD